MICVCFCFRIVENSDITVGGVIAYSHPIRIKHLASDLYLCLDGNKKQISLVRE